MADIPATPNPRGAGLNTQTAYAQSLPQALRGENAQRSLDGQVIRHNDDGTTRIETNRGQIDVRINGEKPPAGSRVSVDVIPSGRGEAQIRIQVKSTPPQAQAPSAPPQNQAAEGQRPPQRVNLPPETLARPATTTAAQSVAQSKALEVGQAVRLVPLPAGTSPQPPQSQSGVLPQNLQLAPQLGSASLQILPQSVQAALNNLLPAAINTPQIFTANLAALSASNQLIKLLLNFGAQTAGQTASANASLPLLGGNSQTLQGQLNITLQSPIAQGTPSLPQASSGLIQNGLLQNIIGQSSILKSSLLTMPQVAQAPSTTLQGASTPTLLQMNNAHIPQSGNFPQRLTLSGQSLQINARILGIQTPSILQGNNTLNLGGQGIQGAQAENVMNARPGQILGIIGQMVQTDDGPRQPVTLFNGGRPVAGQFLLPQGTQGLQPGTQLHMSILNTQQLAPTGQPLQSSQGLNGFFQLLADNDLFTQDLLEILETIQGKGSAEAAQAAMRLIPQAGSPARMTSTILFFMAALKGGDFKQWLGERAATLLNASGSSNVLGRAERSFNALSRMFGEPVQVPGGEWRSLHLPMLFGPDLSRLQMHIRDYDHGQGGSEGGDDEPLKRVIIEFSMSRMGDMQLDSLLMNKRLETVLRSLKPFSSEMRQDLRRRYTDIMAGIGYQGQLDFQTTDRTPA